jgi:hypothetical protein
MARQTNTPKEWRLLAERDMSVADHLTETMRPIPTEIIAFFCKKKFMNCFRILDTQIGAIQKLQLLGQIP